MMERPSENVALIGLGSIGISFAALHLVHGTGTVTVFDNRPDLKEHLQTVLPGYLSQEPSIKLEDLLSQGRLVICPTLKEACANADIVQEQGPDNIAFKKDIWNLIEDAAPKRAHFWSSTSGIAASLQNQAMRDRSRLTVVHPFNPPHILPLIEVVPSPHTNPEESQFACDYFRRLKSGHRPIIVKKELPGFVGNRLAYILFREAAYLVNEDIVSVEDLDVVVQASLGPRFAVQGPFQAYHMGGRPSGIRGFLRNLNTTIQNVWDSYVNVNFSDKKWDDRWVEKVIQQTEEAYGAPNVDQLARRDRLLRSTISHSRD